MRGQKDSLEQRHFAAVSLTTLQEFWDCSMVSWDGKKCQCTFNKVLCDSTLFFSVCLYVLVWVGQGTKQYKYHMSKHDSFLILGCDIIWKGLHGYYFMAMANPTPKLPQIILASLGNLFNYTTKTTGGFFKDIKFQGI